MSSELAEEMHDLKCRDEEVQDDVKQAVEDALSDINFVSVYNVTQGHKEGSVKVQLNYGKIEELLNNLDEFQGLDISIHSGDIYVNPEDDQ